MSFSNTETSLVNLRKVSKVFMINIAEVYSNSFRSLGIFEALSVCSDPGYNFSLYDIHLWRRFKRKLLVNLRKVSIAEVFE